MGRLIPSFAQGYARSPDESENPGGWRQQRGLWVPALGPTGLNLWDVSGFGKNDGVLTNGPTWTGSPRSWVLSYDGGDDYVAVGTGVWNSTGPVSFCFWNRAGLTDENGFGGHGTDNSDDRMQTHAPYSDGTLYWDYGDSAGNGRLSVAYNGYEDKWTHVALLSEGAGGSAMWIYLDGKQVASSGASDGPSGAINFDIGAFHRSEAAGDFYHLGQIGLTSLHSRVLTPSEIKRDYADPFAKLRLRSRVFGGVAAPTGRGAYIIGGGIAA